MWITRGKRNSSVYTNKWKASVKMNILFLSLGNFNNWNEGSIYIDLIKRFAKEQDVYVVCKRERCENKKTEMLMEQGIKILYVKTGNIKNVCLIEKGISTLLIELQFKKAIKRYFPDIKFDLVLYTTPPITFANVVKYVKKRDGAVTYLMLKDIFPQNAVDMGMMSKVGWKGLIYSFFRRKEKELYRISDYIGCMSPANMDYVISKNSFINKNAVEVCPNSVIPDSINIDEKMRNHIREKYSLPLDKKIFVYGGNLGKPQGIPFLIKCLKSQKNNKKAYFIIVGEGTEYGKLEAFVKEFNSENMRLMKNLPKKEYDMLISACDVGRIFLDHRFTIPNFPSRLLGYMQAKLPVLACTDKNTDIGKVVVEGGFGWWCESNDVGEFGRVVERVLNTELESMKEKAFLYLKEHYSVDYVYRVIMGHFTT